MTGRIHIGAPGSISRFLCERSRAHFGYNRFVILEYADNPTRVIVRAGRSDEESARRYMAPGRFLFDLDHYYHETYPAREA